MREKIEKQISLMTASIDHPQAKELGRELGTGLTFMTYVGGCLKAPPGSQRELGLSRKIS